MRNILGLYGDDGKKMDTSMLYRVILGLISVIKFFGQFLSSGCRGHSGFGLPREAGGLWIFLATPITVVRVFLPEN